MIWILLTLGCMILAIAAVVVLTYTPPQGLHTYLHLEPEQTNSHGIRFKPARSGTITQETYDKIEKLGATPQYLEKLRGIIRDD